MAKKLSRIGNAVKRKDPAESGKTSKKLPPIKPHGTADANTARESELTTDEHKGQSKSKIPRRKPVRNQPITASSSVKNASTKQKMVETDTTTEKPTKTRKKPLKPKEKVTTEENTQWTSIVKRVQIHKHQNGRKTKAVNSKRRELALRRKKSNDFTIENTWVPKGERVMDKKPKTKSNKLKSTQSSSQITTSVLENIPRSRQTESDGDGSPDRYVNRVAITSMDEDHYGYGKDISRDLQSQQTSNKPTSSPKQLYNGSKAPYSPKLHSREASRLNQINVGDLAKLSESGLSKTPDTNTNVNQNIADYQYRLNKVRFKGAGNSVPSNDQRRQSIISQNDNLLSQMAAKGKHKAKDQEGKPPMYVSKIEPKSQLSPNTVPHRNKFMDMLILDANGGERSAVSTPQSCMSLPRIHFGSPPPVSLMRDGDDEDMGEITLIVPKLPHLQPRTPSPSQLEVNLRSLSTDDTDTSKTDDDPVFVITNENGEDIKASEVPRRDDWESGYSSMSPRLSIDSRPHALTPMSSQGSLMLEVPAPVTFTPIDQRCTTPGSSYLELPGTRPQSSLIDFSGDYPGLESFPRKFATEARPPILPAIYSRNTVESDMDEHRFEFTPLPIQSVRTSDGEISD